MGSQEYGRCVAFLIDSPRPNPSKRRQGPDVHRAKYSEVRTFFQMKTNVEVRDVSISTNTPAAELLSVLDREIRTLKDGDLAIVYFFGNAGFGPPLYSWRLRNNDNSWVNACAVLEKFTKATHCLFLLDCGIPTNWPDGKKLARPSGAVAEIISSRGIEQKDPDGNLALNTDRDFTYCLVNALEKWVDEIDTTYKNHKALRTIPQAMKDDKEIMNHPDRIDLVFQGAKDLGYVRIDPEDIRRTGQLRFFPPPKAIDKLDVAPAQNLSAFIPPHPAIRPVPAHPAAMHPTAIRHAPADPATICSSATRHNPTHLSAIHPMAVRPTLPHPAATSSTPAQPATLRPAPIPRPPFQTAPVRPIPSTSIRPVQRVGTMVAPVTTPSAVRMVPTRPIHALVPINRKRAANGAVPDDEGYGSDSPLSMKYKRRG